MTSDRLFVYGTLMRGFDHPMAKLLSANADFLGEARCRGRLYLIKHYPGLVLSDDPADIVLGELFRLREREAMLHEFDMYEACGDSFPQPTEYVRQMLPRHARRRQRDRSVDLHLQLARDRTCRASPRESFWSNNLRVPDAVQRASAAPQSRDPRLRRRKSGPRLCSAHAMRAAPRPGHERALNPPASAAHRPRARQKSILRSRAAWRPVPRTASHARCAYSNQVMKSKGSPRSRQ